MIENLLKALGPAAVVALILLAAAWRPWSRAAAPHGHWGTALALSLGYIATDLALRFLPVNELSDLFPAGTTRWAPHAVLAAAIVTLPPLILRSPKPTVLALLLAPVAAASVLAWRLTLTRPPGINIAQLAVSAAALGSLVALAHTVAAHRVRDLRLPAAAIVAWTALAVALVQSKTLAVGQAVGSVAVVLTLLTIVSALRPTLGVMRGSGLALGGIAAAIFMIWQVAPPAEARPTLPARGLIALTLLLPALLCAAPAFRRLRPLPAAIVGCALTAAAGAAAIWRTAEGFDFSGL